MLTVDGLEFAVRRSPRRTTIEITVDRGGELRIAAPEHCPDEAIEAFVRAKAVWIHSKRIEKGQRLRPPPVKQFVTGEGFPYLGRSYRLLLVEDQDRPLKLEHGRFKLRRDRAAEGRAHLVRWYTDHARPWLRGRAARLAGRIGVAPVGVEVLDLGNRWGSCSPSGRLNFHWRTVLLPATIAEYVVAHEVVHLVEPHHGPAFWSRVERILPDWQRLKSWLADRGPDVMF